MSLPTPNAKAVFDVAHEIASPAERGAYLDHVCAGRPEVRAEVEGLLRALDKAGRFLEPSAAPPSHTPPPPSGYSPPPGPPATTDDPSTTPHSPPAGPVGLKIPRHNLLRKLDAGGMGAVYLAEQLEPIRRRVAVKVIHARLGESADIRARFDAERQALSAMEHPGIAKVFEADATEDGTPYLVMELIDGRSITKHCDAEKLPLAGRLRLFLAVCDAVQHAHLKGVMHRDLKPSNVLVALQDGAAVPKVIDFGLAKGTERPLTDDQPSTHHGGFVGTPEYASPEQASLGKFDIDTRSDVYSLGVILYELLTGTIPLDQAKLKGAGLLEKLQRLRDEEPPRPSTRVVELPRGAAKVAEARGTDPAGLAKALRGELDWIALKALAKDRDGRYQTPRDLAQDIRRYLDDEPVEAQPPTRLYRLGKFVRKNRVATAFVGLLALSVIGLTVGVVLVNAERRRAEQSEDAAFNAFLTTEAMVEELLRPGRKLDQFQKGLLSNLAAEYAKLLGEVGTSARAKEIAARLQFVLGRIQEALGRKAEAAASYEAAAGRYEALVKSRPKEAEYRRVLQRCFHNASVLHEDRDRKIAAARRATAELEWLLADGLAEPAQRRDLADALNNLAAWHREGGQAAEAEKAARRAAGHAEEAGALRELAVSRHALGNLLRDRGQAVESLREYDAAVSAFGRMKLAANEFRGERLIVHWDRATAMHLLGRWKEADEGWGRALEFADDEWRGHATKLREATRAEAKLAGSSRPTGAELYDAAAAQAGAAGAAAAVGEPLLARRYAERSQALLKQAGAAGQFRDAAAVRRLAKNDAFKSLPPEWFGPYVEGLNAAVGGAK